MIDPGSNYLHVGVRAGTSWGFADAITRSGGVVLSLVPDVPLDYTLPKWYWLPTTCASIVAYGLGMRTWWPVTPLGLYRKLIRQGAVHYGKNR